jgi:hypothetical protein
MVNGVTWCGKRNSPGNAPRSLSGDRPPGSMRCREFCGEVDRLRAAIRAEISITRDEDSAAAAQILIAVQAEEVREA